MAGGLAGQDRLESVLVIDLGRSAISDTLPMPVRVSDLALAPDGWALYVGARRGDHHLPLGSGRSSSRSPPGPVTPAGACRVERGAVYAATGFHGELGPTVVLVIVADEYLTGVAPVPGTEIRKILSTLRPAP